MFEQNRKWLYDELTCVQEKIKNILEFDISRYFLTAGTKNNTISIALGTK